MFIRWFFVLIACAAVFTIADDTHADVLYSQSVEYYEIGHRVRSRQGIWNAVRHEGAVATERNAIGLAQTSTKWQYRTRQVGDACSLVDLTIDLHVKITLPAWEYRHGKSKTLTNYFACVQDTVTIHENRHATISREMAEVLDRTLTRKFRNVSCRGFRDRVTRSANRVFSEARRRQDAFDRADAKAQRIQRCSRIGSKRYRQIATAKTIKRPIRRQRTELASNWQTGFGRDGRTKRRHVKRPEAIRTRRNDDKSNGATPSPEAEDMWTDVPQGPSSGSGQRAGQSVGLVALPDFGMLGLMLMLLCGAAWFAIRLNRSATVADGDSTENSDWQERAFETIRSEAAAGSSSARHGTVPARSKPAKPAHGKPVAFGRRTGPIPG